MFSIGTRCQKRLFSAKSHIFFSRNYHVAPKLEQLEQSRKKHLKAHLAGYQRLAICFEPYRSVFKILEVIKGQESVLWENGFSWINFEVPNKLRTIILASMWFTRRGGSKHVLDDLDRSISKFDLRSSQVKVMWWFREVVLHISRCALTRQRYCYHSHVWVSFRSKVIDKKAEIRRNVPPRKVIRGHELTSVVFVNNFWLNRE